jgi:hypothetical protein
LTKTASSQPPAAEGSRSSPIRRSAITNVSLDRVLGIRAVAEHGDRDRVQPRAMALQKHAQACHLPGLRETHQRSVIQRGHGAILPRGRAAICSSCMPCR